MTAEILNGDYVKHAAGLKEIEHADELLQNILIALTVHRGNFYPDKNFGTHCFGSADYAFAYAGQALNGLNGVYIKSVKENKNGFDFTVIINHCERRVSVSR